MRFLLLFSLLALGILSGWPAAAQSSNQPALADSLLQLPHWPVSVQRQLARHWLPGSQHPAEAARVVAAAEEILRQPASLDAQARLDLTGNLGGYYIHVQQPSRAIAKLLACRQLAGADSARRAEAAVWLSYCYTLLEQGRPALAFGREALRQLPRRDPNYPHKVGQALCMVANGAELLHDYAQQAACFRRCVTLSRQAGDRERLTTDYVNLATAVLNQGNLLQAAALLDSSRQVGGPHPAANIEQEQRKLAARLALARHQYAAAEQALRPGLHRAVAEHEPLWETEVLHLLVPALAGQGRYREALRHQQRLAALQAITFEEKANRRAQELEADYAASQREHTLGRQRQRIALLQARQAQQAAEHGRQLAWLGLAALAALLATAAGLWWWISRQRRQRVTQEERLRSRIAADLHDEVGTLLARVSMQADLLSQQQLPEAANPALARLLGNSRAAARTMRDIVWSIDAQADTVGALLDRMRDHLDQTAAPAGLRTHLHTDRLPDDLPLPPELRQHLYLVFKEAVTNAVRHAVQPTELSVRLTHQPDHTLLLAVEDDGQPSPQPPGRSGMGLRNMRQRATALRGELLAGPQASGGFRVQLTAPLR